MTQPDQDQLANQFEAERERLRAIASRMLGSASEADDAVQETWFRLSSAESGEIENLPGWLTRVTSRICLDHLRSRKSRREDSLEQSEGFEVQAPDNPEHDAIVADSIGSALMVVLDRLSPAERVAFVLHDSFEVPFEEIAPIIDRTPAATRQLASRARRKVQGSSTEEISPRSGDLAMIDAFLTASRNGDMTALLRVLAPDVMVRADATAVSFGVDAVVEGHEPVAAFFNGKAAAAFLARIDGGYGAVWMAKGSPRVAFHFTIQDGVIQSIELVGDPTRLGSMEYELITRRKA